MSSVWKLGVVAMVFSYLVACTSLEAARMSERPERLVQPMVDILVVTDNSGTMSAHQTKMANAVNGLMKQLDEAQVDFHIAVTTADISNLKSLSGGNERNGPSLFNGRGDFQDGRLVLFRTGRSYLTNQDPHRDILFAEAMARPETLHCEESGYTECPSADGRAIYAANMVLDGPAKKFFRPLAPLVVLILSNQDERGLSDKRGFVRNGDADLMKLYPLENYDLGATFHSKFQAQFEPKQLIVFSIVVKPGDVSCLNAESHGAQLLWAHEGYSYASLAQETGGVAMSICESNYGPFMREIASRIPVRTQMVFNH